MQDVILRLSNKEIHAKGGLLHFGKIITKLTSLESITRHLLPKGVYKTDDCIKDYLANLADAKSDFEAINNLKNDSICKKGFGISEVPSEETVRQRMDELANIKTDMANITSSSLVKKQSWIINLAENNQIEANEVISELTVEFLKRSNAKISVNGFGYVPVDIDTTTLDNSKTQKEGVEYTYRNFDGYSPIAAFIGEEGWNIGAELRPGSQHGQKNMDLFLQKIIDRANFLTPQNQLYRLDSAFDAVINFGILLKNKKDFIIKRNTGRITNKDELFAYASHISLFKTIEKTDLYNSKLVKIGEDIIEEHALFSLAAEVGYENKKYESRFVYLLKIKHYDKKNNKLLFPEHEIHAWATSLPEGQENAVIELYKQHATSEQFHSEFKTDLDLERLPSGKFATNTLIFNLASLTYNALKYLATLAEDNNIQMKRHSAKRRRIRTIIQEIINVPVMICSHARQLFYDFCIHSFNYYLHLNIHRKLKHIFA